MAARPLVQGAVADQVGRTTILGCLAVMTVGMLGAAASAGGVGALSAWRLVTGLGIGDTLSATNAAVAEATNLRHSDRAWC